MSDDINVEEYKEKIESFFDKEVADIISSEVGTLGQISKLCESIEEKIRELYNPLCQGSCRMKVS